jgi:hypothetical protein
MRVVRRHLRLGTATWLVCHVLAFSALAPRDCCAAHAHEMAAADTAAAVDHSAHGMPAAATAGHEHHAAPAESDGQQCPMRGPDGAPCPMHDGGSAAPAACQMTGVCNQPAAALAAVLMQAGVPQQPFALLPRHAQPVARIAADDQPRSLAVPPDSPPPRL